MPKKLVIVESPTKARTIARFLGKDVHVMASMGHVRDLPGHDFGVDIAHGFEPTYTITPGGKKIIAQLSKAAADATDIYLATDPDREGEAIAWHLQEVLKKKSKGTFHRVAFHEITRSAIQHAFEQSAAVDMPRVDAQQARRILDRLVGYKVSPLLWKNIKRGTSAGRVQSVALRLIVEREREILAFTPEEYWNLTATFLPEMPPQVFATRLFKLDGEKPQIGDAETAVALTRELERAAFKVVATNTRPKKQRPSPPFITSTLQQAAGGRLRFSTRQTMQVAQQLYEGVDIGAEGAVGLITYMRTDSVAIAKEAQESARRYVSETYGADYVPAKPNTYRSGKGAQAAHEAIRPTDVNRSPKDMAPYLDARQLKLYTLIWNRFVASQMTPAQLKEHTVDVAALPGDTAPALTHEYLFRATATKTVFPGYTRVYGTGQQEEDEASQDDANALPDVKTGVACALETLDKEQKFTEPPRRYSEAALVRALEQNGVGRPSTYASIIHTVQSRDYVSKAKGALVPSELGCAVNDYLVGSMPNLFDIGFTASMEEKLDEIEEGRMDLRGMLEEFYENFRQWVVDVDLIHAPKPDVCQRFLTVFPDDFDWNPPEKRGRTTYDDGKFKASISDRLDSGQKLTDRQWVAVLGLAAKYADKLPRLPEMVDSLGLQDEFATALLDGKKKKEAAKQREKRDEAPPSALAVELTAALRHVDWAEPEKRGNRVYDDKKFFTSLKSRIDDDKPLTDRQEQALVKLFLKYRGQAENFAEVAAKHTLDAEAEPVDEAAAAETAELLAVFDRIQEWNPPRKVGRRTYDDQDFAKSVINQFARKKTLSDRQVGAVKKLLSRYHGQLPDYAELQAKFNLPAGGQSGPEKSGGGKAALVEETCPECGKQLVLRNSKRGPFLGCSGYPKCRFTKEAPSA
ncbi:MAG: type I DNA topoisomerase [Lentisphaeria bacterium]|nr:type I DNA topoisomerase [Lentisphaeria bacterium]